MRVLTTPQDLEPFFGSVLVPTMGALHQGHLSLIKHAAEIAAGREVVVSIFVNPTQFAPGEDLDTYPRDLQGDLELAKRAGASAAFTPAVATMYPGEQPTVFSPLPEVALRPGLEETHRPQFFHGVCLAVRRLFDLVRPAGAIFGEKDYQQLLVIREMVRLLGMQIDIIGRPTVREPDGLAMSSRNAYLNPERRERALGLRRALLAAAAEREPAIAEGVMRQTLRQHDLQVQYAVIRDAGTLLPVRSLAQPARALVAARLGAIRLIDNVPVP